MKKNFLQTKGLRKFFALFILTSMTMTQMSYAKLMTSDQYQELYVNGTITDENGKVWKVRVIPGVTNIKKNASEAWVQAGLELKEFVKAEFWDENVKKQFDRGTKNLNDSIFKFGIYQIQNHYNDAATENQKLDSETFGLTFIKVYNWLKFTGKSISTTLYSLFSTAFYAAYTVIVPTGSVILQPLKSIWYGGVEGGIYPAAVYIWNGTAWVGTYYSHVPKEASYWVEISGINNQTYKLDIHGLSAIITGSLVSHMTKTQIEELNTTYQVLNEEYKRLWNKIDENRLERFQIEKDLENNDHYKLMRTLISEALIHSESELDNESRTIFMDDAKLRELIHESAKKLELKDFSEEQVDLILEKIKTTVQEILKQ
jgi:hypothetical protein